MTSLPILSIKWAPNFPIVEVFYFDSSFGVSLSKLGCKNISWWLAAEAADPYFINLLSPLAATAYVSSGGNCCFDKSPKSILCTVDTVLPMKIVDAMTSVREDVTITERLSMAPSSILRTRPKATAPLIMPAYAIKSKSFKERPDLYPKSLNSWNYLKMKYLLNELDDSNGANSPENHHIDKHANTKPKRPVMIHVGEYRQAKVTKYERLYHIAYDLKCDWCWVLSLGREIVPGELPHKDTACKEGHDTRYFNKLCGHIGEITKTKHEGALNYGGVRKNPKLFEYHWTYESNQTSDDYRESA